MAKMIFLTTLTGRRPIAINVDHIESVVAIPGDMPSAADLIDGTEPKGGGTQINMVSGDQGKVSESYNIVATEIRNARELGG